MKLEIAQLYFREILANAAPHCYEGRCTVAGSIRRERPEVGDIELVAVPKQGSSTAFWGSIIILDWKPQTKVTTASRYVRLTRNTPHGVLQLDVFLPQAFDWGRQLAIRTGPSDYSARIASAWVKKGYRGTESGLLPESDCIRKGEKWVVKPNTEPHPVHFPTEGAFFEWLGWEWVEPSKRF